MSLVVAGRNVEPISLVRVPEPRSGFPQLEIVGSRLIRGLADYFTGLTGADASITAAKVCLEEAARVDGFAQRSLCVGEHGSIVSLALDRSSLMLLVDRYYGGEGTGRTAREQLSPAENRFLTRLAEAFCDLLAAAWKPIHLLQARIVDEPLPIGVNAVQTFEVICGGWPSFKLECRYPLTTLTLIGGAEAETAQSQATSAEWQEHLTEGALQVRFPVRAVLAEPELPLGKLVRLRPGDVIPVHIPAQMDLTVAGIRLAKGSVGDSEGRAAFRIEQI